MPRQRTRLTIRKKSTQPPPGTCKLFMFWGDQAKRPLAASAPTSAPLFEARTPFADISATHINIPPNDPALVHRKRSRETKAENNEEHGKVTRPLFPRKIKKGFSLRTALPPSVGCMARETAYRQLKVSKRFLIRDFISTEHDSYPITDEFQNSIPPFQCVFSNHVNSGKSLVIASEEGKMYFIDTKYDQTIEWRTPRSELAAHDNAIFDVQWSPDDRYLATASGDQTVRVWDVETRRELYKFRGNRCSVKCVNWDPSNPNIVASGSRDGLVLVWDIRTPTIPIFEINDAHAFSITPSSKRRRTATIAQTAMSERSVTALTFVKHRDNVVATAGGSDGRIKYWDLRSSFRAFPSPIACSESVESKRPRGLTWMTLDPSGSHIFASSLDNHVYQYNAHFLGAPLRRFTAPDYRCKSFFIRCTVSPDGQFIASGSAGDHMYCWEVERPERGAMAFRGHKGEVTSVDWCKRDIGLLASCSDDATVRVWRCSREDAALLRAGSNERPWGFVEEEGEEEKEEEGKES
ncbi:uncharacterized protein VTP21DRAFT_3900 [Calcarisporiella thermophila]|uniref:uncharacterized protein n=1 Tax=Calcarisporiella thermophila TaxID=911321 RepID=UPI00374200DD